MRYSHSNVEKFHSCAYAWFLRYAKRLKTLPNYDADNALIWGQAAHLALQENYRAAERLIKTYFPICGQEHFDRLEHLRRQTLRASPLIPPGGACEVEVKYKNDFVGYIDYLVKNDDGSYTMYDFKYTSDGSRYTGSPQLSLYKYFWERITRKKIRDMYYVIIPKNNEAPYLKEDTYRFHHVVNFLLSVKEICETTDFPKSESYLCRWCEYEEFCQKGLDYMLLPENKRRNIEGVTRRRVWIYGAPFSGKTTFANAFPDPLMLNTDGNVTFVDAPFISIKNIVETEGRITKTTLAWQIFKDAIAELEKKENTFKTIVVDLLEDLYEHCRLYMYDKLSIEHESDDSFRAWDKVRTEFLSTVKRLMNLDYENIVLISHEDSSKDLTRRTGDKITNIKPNIQDKIANKIAGMVDIVARVVAEDDERKLSVKPSEVVFGGGRLNIQEKEINLEYEAFTALYGEVHRPASAPVETETPAEPEEKPATRRRRATATEEEQPVKEEKPVEEEKPATRRRRSRE